MAPFAKNSGPRKRSWAAVAILSVFVAGFVAATAFGGALGGAASTSSSSSTDSSAASSSTSTDAATTTTADTTTAAPTTDATTTDATTTAATTTTTPAPTGTPTIASDKADYNPGATVILTGHGWGAGEAVHVNVNDDVGQTWTHDADATADASGDFIDQFTLPDWFVADYTVRASGASGAMATATFTDSSVQNVTVTVNPTTAGVNAAYTIKFSPSTGNGLGVGDFVQITFPSGTTIPASIAAANITVNGTSATGAASIQASQRQVQVNTPVALPASAQATVVIGATSAVIGNPSAATYQLQVKTQNDNQPANSANYTIVNVRNTSTALASSANPVTYGSAVTLTATVAASPTPNPSGVGTVTFKDGTTVLCNAVPLAANANTATCAPSLDAGSHNLTAEYSGTSNFSASTSSALTQTVNPKAVTGSFTASNKVYDSTTTATIATRSLSGSIAGDEVSLAGGAASFADKNVGNGKTVTATGFTLSGARAGNYSLGSVPSTTANLTPAPASGSFTASNKVYDGNASATVVTRGLGGAFSGDTVSLSGGTAAFDNRNVGNAKTVTLTGASLAGVDAGNYSLTSVATTTANISPKAVTGSFTAEDKVYDGTTAATMLTRSLAGAFSGDTVTLSGGTALFADKNVGNGKTVTATGFTLNGADAGNYTLGSVAATTANITAKSLTASFTAANKVYDRTTAATVTGRSLSGAVAGDPVTLTGGTATFDTKSVGNGKTVTLAGASLSGADASNYVLGSVATTTADVTAASVTGSFAASSKVYDGNASATVLSRTLSGVISGDTVSLSGGTAAFDTKDVGTGKTVTLAGASLGGADAGNYTLTSVATTTANVTAKPITGSFTAGNKVYDSTTAATVTSRSLSGDISGDDVSLTGGTAVFDNTNVGIGKTVTLSGASLSGSDAGNYSLGSVATTTANITQAPATGSFTADNKIYDGNTSVTVLTRSVGGVFDGDVVSLTGGTASFADRNVGNGKTVTLTGASLTGADAGNYSLGAVATTTANITAKPVTGSFTAENKVYDGNTSATIGGRSLSGKIPGDDVSLSGGAATFDTKSAGDGKTVTSTGFGLDGADAGNYSLNSSTLTTAANITPKPITGSFTAADKVYDRTTAATVTDRSLSGWIAGDDVSLTGGTATFDTRNVGNGKAVTLGGASLSGAHAGNYSLRSVDTTTANITPKEITGSFTASSKVYDGNTSATVTGRSLTGVISPDYVSLSGSSAAFDTKDVGVGKTVTLAGASLAGGDAGNYTLMSVATTTANVTAKPITGSFTADDKVYDSTTTATVPSRSPGAIIGGDDVSLTGGTATFDNKSAGTGKTVTLSGASLSGSDAGNYSLGSVATTTANITRAPATGSFTADNKIYDGNTSATVLTRSAGGVFSGDDVSLTGGTASFDTKNVGNGKTVALAGASLTGADAGNYSLGAVATTTANITPNSVTGNFTAENKVYDGNTSATISGRSLTGKIAGDDLSLSGGTATFDTKSAGDGKTVTSTGFGLDGGDAGNYVLASSTLTTTANITAKPITGSFTADNKVYDATAAAAVTDRSLSGTISGDVVSLTGGTAAFANKNVGNGKTVTLTGPSLSGPDAGNYSLTSVATATANITAAPATGSFTAGNKVYDGNTSATVLTRTPGGIFSDDTVSLTGGTAAFDNKNVGMGKTVTLTGASLSGGDAGNYMLTSVATATANVGAKPITGSFTAANKVYDSTPAGTITGRSLSGTIVGDAVSLTSGTASFDTKNVGNGKTVTGTGFTLSGGDAGNYSLSSVGSTTANITPALASGSFTADSKVYDGDAAATVLTRAPGGIFGGDGVSLTGGTASFADRNVGNGKTVTLTGASLSGADAGNYSLGSVATTAANITPRGLTVTATGANKVYDGTANATAMLETNKVTGDAVTATYAGAAFNDKNAGTGKTINVSGVSISGADSGNYALLNTTASTTANITVKPIAGSFTAANKIYDGTTAATVLSRSLISTIAGDNVALSGGSATFADAAVGVGKTVTLTGAALSGADAANYALLSVSNTAASITAWNAQSYGFYAPIGLANSTFTAAPAAAPLINPGDAWNTAKGGSTVPLKFNIFAGNVEKTALADIKSFQQSKLASCTGGTYEDLVEELSTTGATTLRYDTTAQQWIQNWATPKVAADTCYRAWVTFADGSSLEAFFKLKK